MADDAMHFIVDEGGTLTARDAVTALTVTLPTVPGSAKFQIQRTALVAIQPSTYVVDQPGNTCTIADPRNMAHLGRVLGIVVGAVAAGATATIQVLGLVPGVVGTFGAGDSLFIGDGQTGRVGAVVNTQPVSQAGTDTWRQQVGTATTTTLINGALGPAYKVPALSGAALVVSSGGYALQATPSQIAAGTPGVWVDAAGVATKTDLDPVTDALAAGQVPKALGSQIVVTPSMADLNAAIAAVAATYDPGTRSGGGDIHIPAITLTGSGIVQRSGVKLKGRGTNNTILKIGNGANADVLVGVDTYANLGQLNDQGIRDWSLEDLTVDGNRANNSSGSGVKVFGFRYLMKSVEIRNCRQCGLYTDGGAYVPDAMEATFFDILIDTCGEHGWAAYGPHDSDATKIIMIDSGLNADNSFCGLLLAGTMNGRFRGLHPWCRSTTTNRMQFGLRDLNGGSNFSGSHFEGARQVCASFEGSSSSTSDDCMFYASYGTDVVVVRGTENRIRGTISGGLATQPAGGQRGLVLGYGSDYCANNDIDVTVHQCLAAAVDFGHSAGANRVFVHGYVGGTAPNGSASAGYLGVPKTGPRLDYGRVYVDGAAGNATWSA